MFSLNMNDIVAYLLVFMRMGGMFFLNPIISRRNVPARFRIALVLGLTIILVPTLNTSELNINTDFALIYAMFFELVVGIAFNYVFQVFYYMIYFAGDMMDFQFGLSMAKVFDPGTNIQASVSGSLLNIMFILYFFASNCHQTLIRLMVSSYDFLPLASMKIGTSIISYGSDLFVAVFSLMLKLIVPFIVLEFIIEIAMGILMKLIPQIHVFVINIQFKIIIAFVMLLLLATPIAEFLDTYLIAMFTGAQEILKVLSSG